MDKKSKILMWILIVILTSSVILAFYRTMIKHDYLISQQVSCNPAIERCFENVCNPVDDDTCSQNPNERISYYKIVEKKAYNVPLCDPNKDGESCPEMTCLPQEKDCTIILND